MDNYLPQRKQLRLKDYDYSRAGFYFITICTKDRLGLFGEIVGVDDSVHPTLIQESQIGKTVYGCWNKINEIYDNVKQPERMDRVVHPYRVSFRDLNRLQQGCVLPIWI